MIPLPSAVSSELTWLKPRNRTYELRSPDGTVGTLERPGFWSSTYVAETQHGRWTFHRSGFWGNSAEIVDPASQQPVATFTSEWGSGGGVLAFSDGEKFTLSCKGWWHPVWTVAVETGEPQLHVHVREKSVELISPAAVPAARLSLLMMFVWYRVLQAEEDAASAAAVAVIAAS